MFFIMYLFILPNLKHCQENHKTEAHLFFLAGQRQVDRYVEIADRVKGSPLEANVETQRTDIVNRFRLTLATSQEVQERMEAMHGAHRDFQVGVEKAKSWMDESWEKIRQNSYSTGKSREELQVRLH